jgi:hypothetical protein
MLYNAFIEKGVLRSYSTDDKGMSTLCNLHLRAGGLVIFLVFLLGSTSTYTIEAIEDSGIVVAHLCCKGGVDGSICFEGTKDCFANAFIALQGRVNAALNSSAEEKYIS